MSSGTSDTTRTGAEPGTADDRTATGVTAPDPSGPGSTPDADPAPAGTAANAAGTTTVAAPPEDAGKPSDDVDPDVTGKREDPQDGEKAKNSNKVEDGGQAKNSKANDSKKVEDGKDAGKAADGKDATERADAAGGEPSDPWQAFGPAPETVPGRLRRAARAVGRFLVHEWTLATLGSLVLAVLLTWPTLRYPLYTLPQDYYDPALQAWQVAWSGHILLTDPAQLWQANTFYPESWSFAFSDTLLGYAPAGMIGTGPEAAVLRYNILFVLAHALATLGAYALARQLGAGRIGAAAAGVGYAYAPWLLAQAGHLHVISNGGIPLALAMLARGHGWSLRYGYRPKRRHAGWALAGWLVAAWQLSLGFGIGLPFAYVLAGVVLVATLTWYLRRYWIRPVRHPFGARLLITDVVGGLVFAATGALLAIPYFTVAEQHPNARRSIGDIDIYSPPAFGFLTAPAESRIWGGLHEGARAALPWHPEMTLLPGFVLYALALGGLFFSVWRVRHRLLLLAGVLVSMVLAMGTRFFGGTFTYVPLVEHLPGWDGIRTPGRLMLWTTLLLGLLAAGTLTAFAMRVREIAAQRIPPWPGPWLRTATLLPLLLVVVEGLNATPHPVVPPQPAAMRTVEGPVLVLPSGQNLDQPVMLWTTSRFPDVVNGGSGFTPMKLTETRQATQTFPDPVSIDHLRRLGVRTVVVPRAQAAGTPFEAAVELPVDGLGIRREEIGDAVVYHL
ncbi:hypothetical protein [Micromonospora sagamiensis]|uniref:Uncharacterized protein n=1 Tax=Micromonospora sagamiensis TaxID=47875 RepID=A0A562WRU0_9ACTN|nr:hypothetical protein [Micromonospora sagamiensis]TWJ32104.1 hypothetical protein JD81_05676 [Micromonospora sagamiensis]BCL14837.1 hypothetical protein GCM10017556_25760 [Micromonospora sagamiensis]